MAWTNASVAQANRARAGLSPEGRLDPLQQRRQVPLEGAPSVPQGLLRGRLGGVTTQDETHGQAALPDLPEEVRSLLVGDGQAGAVSKGFRQPSVGGRPDTCLLAGGRLLGPDPALGVAVVPV